MDRPLAAIDIGTNTLLLLVGSCDRDGSIVPLADLLRVPRLGAGVDASRQLQGDAIARVIPVLMEFQKVAHDHGVQNIVACATSAVRDAANRTAFLEEVHTRTGLSIEVLSGEEEALLSFHGAVSQLPHSSKATVLDIGGGSTEIIQGGGDVLPNRVSLNIGAVRLTERCFHHDPPLPSEIADAATYIEEALNSVALPSFAPDNEFIAVAGTPTTLATLAQGLKTFSRERVEGYRMPRAEIEKIWQNLHILPSPAIRALSEVLEGREDVITAGTLILRKVMDRLGFAAMTASDRGLRHGILLREFRRRGRLNSQLSMDY
jgi:exopolyphosphatase / guanosine-5'-triphosphate,3'-diphosphate pyrophosphatase